MSFHHYQQPMGAVAAQQHPRTAWNGNSGSWAATNNHTTATTSYNSPSFGKNNLVTKYTEFYHTYSKQAKEWEPHLQSPDPQLRSDAEKQYQWAKYQADESSRAAHFFHQNPGTAEPPFQLPPPPPNFETNGHQEQQHNTLSSSYPSRTHTQHYQATQQQQHYGTSYSSAVPHTQQRLVQPPPSYSDVAARGAKQDESPGSLKQFVHKSLEQCKDQKERDDVTEQVQVLIQQAILANNLHTKDWSKEPLVIPKSRSSRFSQDIPSAHRGPIHASGNEGAGSGYYGPSSASQLKRFPVVDGLSRSSYYGPKPGVQDSHTSSQSRQSTPSNKYDGGYYQPSGQTNSFSQDPAAFKGSTGTISNSCSETKHTPKKKKQKVNADHGYYGPSGGDGPTNAEADFIKLPNSKKMKRKSAGFDQTSNTLTNRAKRFAGAGGLSDSAKSNGKNGALGFDRFMGKGTIGGNQEALTDEDFEKMTVKGTCQTLEKDYLRLTAPPRPELVRPEKILRMHLKNLKSERAHAPSDRRDYVWFCSQFKALRQDCTVQRIQNAFTVDVYETHAKVALEEGDLNEYNQCQTQLKELYRLKEIESDEDAMKNYREFLAYRLLYYVFLAGNKKYTGGSTDLFHLMLSLSAEEKQDPAIRHALRVREAVAEGNYNAFFRLCRSSPNLGSHLLDHVVPSVRFQGLKSICRAYRPSVDVSFVGKELGLVKAPESKDELENCCKWLQSCSCILSEDGMSVNTKESEVTESRLEVKKSLI